MLTCKAIAAPSQRIGLGSDQPFAESFYVSDPTAERSLNREVAEPVYRRALLACVALNGLAGLIILAQGRIAKSRRAPSKAACQE